MSRQRSEQFVRVEPDIEDRDTADLPSVTETIPEETDAKSRLPRAEKRAAFGVVTDDSPTTELTEVLVQETRPFTAAEIARAGDLELEKRHDSVTNGEDVRQTQELTDFSEVQPTSWLESPHVSVPPTTRMQAPESHTHDTQRDGVAEAEMFEAGMGALKAQTDRLVENGRTVYRTELGNDPSRPDLWVGSKKQRANMRKFKQLVSHLYEMGTLALDGSEYYLSPDMPPAELKKYREAIEQVKADIRKQHNARRSIAQAEIASEVPPAQVAAQEELPTSTSVENQREVGKVSMKVLPAFLLAAIARIAARKRWLGK